MNKSNIKLPSVLYILAYSLYLAPPAGQFSCVCGSGCSKEFPFQSREECEAQIKGEIVRHLES